MSDQDYVYDEASGEWLSPVEAADKAAASGVKVVDAVGNALSDGDAVEITAETDAVVLLGHAEPIGEPVFSHGPFVMNTRDEIIQAIQDYQSGKFGPPPRV